MRDTMEPPGRTRYFRSIAGTTWRVVRRVVVTVAGIAVLVVGVVMIVTPGPAFLVIPAGLAILGTEFSWARWQVERLRSEATKRLRRE